MTTAELVERMNNWQRSKYSKLKQQYKGKEVPLKLVQEIAAMPHYKKGTKFS